VLALMRLGFTYTEARALPAQEAGLYLDAWDELNNPQKVYKVEKKKKPKKA